MAEVSGLKKKTAFKSCENRHNIEQRGWGGCGELLRMLPKVQLEFLMALGGGSPVGR